MGDALLLLTATLRLLSGCESLEGLVPTWGRGVAERRLELCRERWFVTEGGRASVSG